LTPEDSLLHTIHMKRTNLVIDEALLDEAHRMSGERTYSRTVERALAEFVRRAKARTILQLTGSGGWAGDLAVVREDRPTTRTRARGSR
jgi:Arc/MetJ family transcription regulator